MGDWTHNTINHLPDSSLKKMLKCEYGGMNYALANLYQLTGNQKYLDLSYEEEKRLAKQIEEKTIDSFRIGEMQPERDHKLIASERSYVDDALGKKGREAWAGNYFQFIMNVDPDKENSLLLTYIGDDKDRKFGVKAEGNIIARVDWKGGKTGKFYDHIYPLPTEITKGKNSINIRIEVNY